MLQFPSVKLAATAVVLAVALGAAGCGNSDKSSAPAAKPAGKPTPAKASAAPAAKPTAGAAKCTAPPDALVAHIRKNILLEGAKVTDAEAVESPAVPGLWFVTARVSSPGAPPDIATWMTQTFDGSGPIWSVDSFAALVSTYGAAVGRSVGLTVDAPGVYRSRVCVAGPGASHGVTAPVSGGKPGPLSG
jgi:hypothetical protein